jgi:acyl carrier protein
MDNVETKMREIIAKIAETDAVFGPDADFRDELGVDSYRGVELIFEIERVFTVRIPPERYEELKTLREAIALVTSLKSSVKVT